MTSVANKIKALNLSKRLFTVSQFSQEYPAFSQSALRHLIFNSQINGFKKVIRRVGKRKILLDEQAFLEWVDEQQKQEGGES